MEEEEKEGKPEPEKRGASELPRTPPLRPKHSVRSPPGRPSRSQPLRQTRLHPTIGGSARQSGSGPGAAADPGGVGRKRKRFPRRVLFPSAPEPAASPMKVEIIPPGKEIPISGKAAGGEEEEDIFAHPSMELLRPQSISAQSPDKQPKTPSKSLSAHFRTPSPDPKMAAAKFTRGRPRLSRLRMDPSARPISWSQRA